MVMSQSGTLGVNIIEGNFTRDTDTFTKMDPWTQLQTRTQTVRTRTMQAAGKQPVWEQAFDLDVKDTNDDITLSVFDEDLFSNDLVSVVYS